MGSYDLMRLEVAVQYIRRMAEGRNPVTNRPAPDNDVLTNINVNRCLKFVEEILTDVHKAGGQVGALPRKSAPRPSLAETFPYEILSEFHYEQDQQISYLLNQIGRPLPEDQKMPVAATVITNWMRENGYLEKRMMQDIGKENSVPTEKGMQLGLYSEKAGMGQNMYYRVYYNEKAQRFIVDNFRRILTEYEEIRARGRKTAKKPAADKAEQTKSADSVFISSGVTEADSPARAPGLMIDPVSADKVGMTLIWHRCCLIFPAETYMTRKMTVSVNLRPWEMDGRQPTRTCPGERHSPSKKQLK